MERHNQLADFLDEHAPMFRQDAAPQLRTHLATLPAAQREFIEAVQAARRSPADSFASIAAAQTRLQVEMARNPDSFPAQDSRPLRDSPQRQAHLRRLHQELTESDPENTPPLKEFLDAQNISRFNEPSTSNPEKP